MRHGKYWIAVLMSGMFLAVGPPATAQTPPSSDVRAVLAQAPDGALYLVVQGQAFPITPATLGGEELAALRRGYDIPDGGFWVYSTAPPGSSSLPAPAAAGAAAEVKPPVVEQTHFFTRDGSTHVAALVKNPNPDRWLPRSNYTITVYDGAGKVLDTDSNVLDLGPGEARWVVAQTSTGGTPWHAPSSRCA